MLPSSDKLFDFELPPISETRVDVTTVAVLENATTPDKRLLWPICFYPQSLYNVSELWVEGISLNAPQSRVICF
jgi:hypothetical protein